MMAGTVPAGVVTTMRSGTAGRSLMDLKAGTPRMLSPLGLTGQTGPPKGPPSRFCMTVQPTLPARSVAPMRATDLGVKMDASGLRRMLTRSWAGSMMSVLSGATVADAMREFSFESRLVSIAGICGDFTAEEAGGRREIRQSK